jgi:hypothetical protein
MSDHDSSAQERRARQLMQARQLEQQEQARQKRAVIEEHARLEREIMEERHARIRARSNSVSPMVQQSEHLQSRRLQIREAAIAYAAEWPGPGDYTTKLDAAGLFRHLREDVFRLGSHDATGPAGPLALILTYRRLRRCENGTEAIPERAWQAWADLLERAGREDIIDEIARVYPDIWDEDENEDEDEE